MGWYLLVTLHYLHGGEKLEKKKAWCALLTISLVINFILAIFCFGKTLWNQPPKAYASWASEADVGEAVLFLGVGVDSDGGIVLEEWDFDGDGIYDWNSREANEFFGVWWYYNRTGTYTAVFKVTDDCGAIAKVTRTIYVEEGLKFSISLVKKSFRVGETINVTATLQNIKHEVICVDDLWWGCKISIDYFIMHNGSILPRRYPVIPGVPERVALMPQQSINETIDLWECYDFGNLTGHFSLQAKYTSRGYEAYLWHYTLYSNIIDFTLER